MLSKLFTVVALVSGLAGCATDDPTYGGYYSQEEVQQARLREAQAWQRAGEAFTDASKSLRPAPQSQPQNCLITDLGQGLYRTDCR